jgi:ATP-dependent Clp protease ATP-binding subunit ClpA
MSDRFDKFTSRAKNVLLLAQEEAQRRKHGYIGTRHLLHALVHEGEGIGAKVLTECGLTGREVERELESDTGHRESDPATRGKLALTPLAKATVEFASEEASLLDHDYVGTEHILLALLRPHEEAREQPVAYQVLSRFGVSYDDARSRVLRAIVSAPPTPQPRGSVVTCRVDSTTLNALDALVEAGVHATRSEAAARLITAGLQANQGLMEQVYAAVADIRRVRAATQALARQWETEAAPQLPAGTTSNASDAPSEGAPPSQ